jgi:hypothetical protein
MTCPGTDVAVADAGTKGATDAVATDAAATAATDIGTTAALDTAGTAGLEEVVISAAPELTAAGGADLATAALAAGTGAALSGGSGGAGNTAGLETVNITGTRPATGGPGAGTSMLAPAALAAGGALAGAGASPATPATPQPAAQPSAIMPGGGPAALSPDVAQTLGVAPDTGAPAIDSAGGGGVVTGGGGSPFMDTPYDVPDSAAQTFGSETMDWLKNPKNLATLGLLGNSAMTALNPPKLPGAAQTALSAAGPAVQEALATIKSGGTGTPLWSQQKASIDASIDQQLQQESEALQQAAANAGEGDPKNSAVVVQQINALKDKMETQRQQLYLQAQQQNVNAALAELTGGNQVLESIAQMQLAQDEAARNAANETARLALMLQSMGG